MTDKKREKLRRIPHIISGLVALLHSHHRYESGNLFYLFFLLAGVVFLLIAFAHHQLASKIPFIDLVFYIIEGALSFIIAFEYMGQGKSVLPFVYVFAGLMQLSAIFFFNKKTCSALDCPGCICLLPQQVFNQVVDLFLY